MGEESNSKKWEAVEETIAYSPAVTPFKYLVVFSELRGYLQTTTKNSIPLSSSPAPPSKLPLTSGIPISKQSFYLKRPSSIILKLSK